MLNMEVQTSEVCTLQQLVDVGIPELPTQTYLDSEYLVPIII